MLLLVMPFLGVSQNPWVKKDSVNGPARAACVTFVAEGEGFLGMGRNFTNDKRSFYSYDFVQDDWDREEDLGGINGEGLERSSAVAFTVHDKGYIGTGKGTTPFMKDLWQFDPISRTWTQKANFEGSPRRMAVAFAIDSFGYVGTGEADSGMTKDFWKYNPIQNEWTEIAIFPGNARRMAVAFRIKGIGYVATGNDGSFLKDVWAYDPGTDNWQQQGDFSGTPRYGATAFVVNSKAYICTGYDSTLSYQKDVWEYTVWSDSWVQKPDFNGGARAFASSFVVKKTAYIGTGFNGTNYLNDFYANQNILSTEDDLETQNVSVYPTLVRKHFFVETDITKSLLLDITDQQGRLIESYQLEAGSNRRQINTSMLSEGLYTIRLSTANEHHFSNHKIVVVK